MDPDRINDYIHRAENMLGYEHTKDEIREAFLKEGLDDGSIFLVFCAARILVAGKPTAV